MTHEVYDEMWIIGLPKLPWVESNLALEQFTGPRMCQGCHDGSRTTPKFCSKGKFGPQQRFHCASRSVPIGARSYHLLNHLLRVETPKSSIDGRIPYKHSTSAVTHDFEDVDGASKTGE